MTTTTVRDKLWIWGHEAGSHDIGYGLSKTSRITPAEAAYYLDVPNMIMVRYRDYTIESDIVMLPKPPYDQYALALRPMKQLVWSFVNEAGVTEADELDRVLDLAGKFPNISGAMMDDFFRDDPAAEELGVHTPAELREVKARLKTTDRDLDLWVVLYAHQLEMAVSEYLEACDVVSFWSWCASELKDIEANFDRLEQVAPHCRKVLGCYMWDYGEKQMMPLASMEHQCRVGLEWIQAGRIDGMIFLASCICDQGLEAVEWTRRWIAEVGDTVVTG